MPDTAGIDSLGLRHNTTTTPCNGSVAARRPRTLPAKDDVSVLRQKQKPESMRNEVPSPV